MENPDFEEMQRLVVPPNNETSKEEVFRNPLLVTRASFFDCGTTSICCQLSHKAGDGFTAVLFLNTWASIAAGEDSSFTPHFTSSSLFHPSESLASDFTEPVLDEDVKLKRLVLSGPAIAALVKRVASELLLNPFRVEAAMALVWSALIAISTESKSAVTFHVKLRNLVAAEFHSENNTGNVVWIYKLESHPDRSNDMKDLVVSVRKGYEEFKESYERRTRMEGIRGLIEELRSLKKSDEAGRLYSISSLCRFGLYELDFGWGKPSLVSIYCPFRNNTVFMLDSKDGQGIEIWVSLTAQDIALFEINYNLAFHSIIVPIAM